MSGPARRAFTLLELLVVTGLIGTLAALLLPSLTAGLEAGRRTACASNIRQLYLANEAYAQDRGHYVAAAPDILKGNLQRWHGIRRHVNEPFDGARGPLVPYLGTSGQIRRCPTFRFYRTSAADNAFESACGAYGYNAIGVGSETYRWGQTEEAMARGIAPRRLRAPSRTLMFADCAFPQPYVNPRYLIEYSFAEPYYFVFEPETESQVRAMPSIHFRHRGVANVVWCDGRVSTEKLETQGGPQFTRFGIGWFGPPDNTYFRP